MPFSGRLFGEDVLAGQDRRARGVVANLRRHAQRHRLDLGRGRQKRLDALEIGNAVHLPMPAGSGDELVVAVFCQGRQMLIPGDLADADNGDVDGLRFGHRQLSSSLSSNGPPARKRSIAGSKGEGSMAFAISQSSE